MFQQKNLSKSKQIQKTNQRCREDINKNMQNRTD